MKKFLFQSILLVIIIGLGLYFFMVNPSFVGLPFLSNSAITRQVQVGNANLKVEIADTQTERSKGLGGRQSLDPDEGMLFIFPEIGRYPFWMKGLNFPLDFVWIRGDVVVEITENVQPPAPNQPDSQLPIYQSKEDVNKVLEVPSGTIKKFNIRVGDEIKVLP